jgi:hypothetical protein
VSVMSLGRDEGERIEGNRLIVVGPIRSAGSRTGRV